MLIGQLLMIIIVDDVPYKLLSTGELDVLHMICMQVSQTRLHAMYAPSSFGLLTFRHWLEIEACDARRCQSCTRL